MKNNDALIGYTGFVGSNILNQREFGYCYNSENIEDIQNKTFDTIICAGVCSKKWWVNMNPRKDKMNITKLTNVLKSVKCNKFILISTIDVYDIKNKVNEFVKPDLLKVDAYGRNRYYLEEFIRFHFENSLIVRLPALYGKGLSKNFIYDLLNPIPQTITKEKYTNIKNSINEKEYNLLKNAYIEDLEGNFSFNKNINTNAKNDLYKLLKKINFTSISFTDYRSEYQFYNLNNLCKDIDMAIENNISLLNLSVEPVKACDLAKECFNINFDNIIENKEPVKYNFKTIHKEMSGYSYGYLYTKEDVYEGVKEFIKKESNL